VHDSLDLSRDECEQLLRAGVVGRVAVSTPTGPHIVPINYSIVEGAIVIRTSPYSLLGTYGRDSMLALEIDQFDYEYQRGWSVVARGRADVVVEPDELEHIRSVWSPRPWASGSRTLYLRVPLTELSGRRLGTGWNVMEGLPVSRVV
jgi:nitroimidazol reductase NimA-like FMN-containing flavoprotein (pyridoxamine 5'-phosphate oxidase superfamily)